MHDTFQQLKQLDKKILQLVTAAVVRPNGAAAYSSANKPG